MDDERLPVFVYGTLRPCRHNAALWYDLADAHHDGTAELLGWRLVSNGSFPYAIPAPLHFARGCLLEPREGCGGELLARLDRLEGVPHHYQRIAVWIMLPTTETLDAEEVRAWAYVDQTGRHADLRPVPGDDWDNETAGRWVEEEVGEADWQEVEW